MQHSSFHFRHSTFHKQQSGFGILPSSSVECTFIFSYPAFSICPLSFRFRHPTLSIDLQVSTFHIQLLPPGQRPIEIVGSIDLTHPRSNCGRETSQSSGLGRPSPLPTNQTSTNNMADRQHAAQSSMEVSVVQPTSAFFSGALYVTQTERQRATCLHLFSLICIGKACFVVMVIFSINTTSDISNCNILRFRPSLCRAIC